MKRVELIRDIRDCTGCGGFISKTKVAQYMGISRNNLMEVEELVKDCDFIEDGRGRQFSVVDVAENIMKGIVRARYE